MLNTHYDATKDYFAILGIHQQAASDDIKRAYRKMARRYHPDVSKIHNAKEKFQEIAEAYEVLTKHKDAYCQDFNYSQNRARTQSHHSRQSAQSSGANHAKRSAFWRSQTPIPGKNREITYPLTLRYAIRLLKIGYFYISGLNLRMKFTRLAFTGKTFRIKGKGYQGLFGGPPGDFFVRFELHLESLKWELRGSDIYGTVQVPRLLLQPGQKLELDSPSGFMTLWVPQNYSPDEYIQVENMGLPGDELNRPGHLYAKLVAA